MKKTIQVNIGKIAFFLDETSFDLINNYLESLKEHYANNKNGEEIISGIEERMAELFLEQTSNNKMVNSDIAQKVIDILGTPEDIDNESGEEKENSTKSNPSPKIRKRFYRDAQNKMIGGVCSGLSHLFNRDASLFRILLVLAAILSFTIYEDSILWFPLLYVIVWAIVPAAKTAKEKREMNGSHISFSDIEKNVTEGYRKPQGNNQNILVRLLKVIGKIFGIIFIISGLVGILSMIFLIFNFPLWGFTLSSLMSFCSSTLDLVVSGGILHLILFFIFFIPLLFILYLGIMIIFNIKVPRWRPGVIMLIIWITSIIVLTIVGFSSLNKYSNHDTVSNVYDYSIPQDTLYVKLDHFKTMDDSKYYLSARKNNFEFFYINASNDETKLVIYPEIYIRHYNNIGEKVAKGNLEITLKKEVFPNTLTISELDSTVKNKFYTLRGNVLTLSPLVLGKEHRLREFGQRLEIAAEKDLVIILKEPRYHDFTTSYKYTNMRWFHIH